ncbi:MAG: GntR family transcriptional regulator [Erysipelotrichaceae bacterium]|nr:GntR family transcriptional regulator [Erysipelotrichaceae bacterium]
MKHQDVYLDLRKKILNKYYAPWSALESEEILCKKYNVSRPTLQKAIAHLKQDGFVHSRQGSGVYINPPEFHKHNNLETLSERFKDGNVTIENKIYLFEKIKSGDKNAIFQINEDEILIHYKRARIIEGKVHSFEETYMPLYLFPDLNEKDLDGSMIQYIEQKCGFAISHDIKKVSAINIDEEMSSILKIEKGKSILQVVHSVYLTRSVLAQYTIEITTDPEIRIASVR